ncbi:MAG TPA: hypothetical protein VFB32_12115 [Rudaea sp.]|nr:hypothetical protein [Rudaea sp.]
MSYDSHDPLETLLASGSDDLCFGFAAHATGEIFALAGDKHLLPFQSVVEKALEPENIVSRYEECEGHAAVGCAPRGYAQGRLSAVIGIPRPGVLLVLFGLMPDGIARAVSDSSEQIAWYWSHRQRVWSAVEAVYAC